MGTRGRPQRLSKGVRDLIITPRREQDGARRNLCAHQSPAPVPSRMFEAPRWPAWAAWGDQLTVSRQRSRTPPGLERSAQPQRSTRAQPQRLAPARLPWGGRALKERAAPVTVRRGTNPQSARQFDSFKRARRDPSPEASLTLGGGHGQAAAYRLAEIADPARRRCAHPPKPHPPRLRPAARKGLEAMGSSFGFAPAAKAMWAPPEDPLRRGPAASPCVNPAGLAPCGSSRRRKANANKSPCVGSRNSTLSLICRILRREGDERMVERSRRYSRAMCWSAGPIIGTDPTHHRDHRRAAQRRHPAHSPTMSSPDPRPGTRRYRRAARPPGASGATVAASPVKSSVGVSAFRKACGRAASGRLFSACRQPARRWSSAARYCRVR